MKINGDIKISETNKTLNDLINSTTDSDWIYPELNSGWTSPYSAARTRYRKIGKIVFLESFVDGTAAASNVVFNLPDGYRPSSQYTRYPAYTADGTVYIDIANNGNVTVLNKNGGITWLAINYCFVAD